MAKYNTYTHIHIRIEQLKEYFPNFLHIILQTLKIYLYVYI